MSKRMWSIVAIVVLALSVSGVYAAEMMPEGVTMVILKESPAPHLPGVAKVRLMEMRIAPGAKLMNYKISDSGFCTAIQGTFTFEVSGKTFTRFAGETWVMKKGATVTAYNRGTVEHVQRMWLLIEK